MTEQRPHVVVLGAGVIGLTAAVFLAESGYVVTIIARHVPGDESIEYTSPWAGAHWRTHATANEPELCDWDMQTFHYWSDLIKSNDESQDSSLPDPCLKMQTSYHLYDSPSGPPPEDLWWSTLVPSFTHLSPPSSDPIVQAINAQTPSTSPKISWAAKSTAISLDAPNYLHYLHSRAHKSGAITLRRSLPTGSLPQSLKAAEDLCAGIAANPNSNLHPTIPERDKVDIFINATGLASSTLCPDPHLFPIKGQTVLVKGEAHSIRTRTGEGYQAYCIPRPGSNTTILGGTKVKDDWSGEVSEKVTREILGRAEVMVPELRTGKNGGFEVLGVQCGLRPGRRGGPRVEVEEVGDGMNGGKGWKVVHCYGHAGAGFQNSVGSGRKVLGLVREVLGRRGVEAKL